MLITLLLVWLWDDYNFIFIQLLHFTFMPIRCSLKCFNEFFCSYHGFFVFLLLCLYVSLKMASVEGRLWISAWDIEDQCVYASDVAHRTWWRLHDSMDESLRVSGLAEQRKIELEWDMIIGMWLGNWVYKMSI
ncbi:unnamed protein product [Cuscuta epithymum]|uniref:Uncharacterized protein n=1 Tax=Cuscuta epithymum TaxID=186058 RepID=A0AAV0DWA1_9ASTE|nr:unnamed protein product [Cuscuta epithymum]